MNPDLTQFARDAAAAPILGWMRDGRWRKARDGAKELVKRERERYLPLLVEANAGLAREMLGKGLVKEAATVVDYLASFAPAARVAALRAELAAPVAKRSAPVPATAAAAGAPWWAAALRVEAAMAAAAEISPADLAAVDLLVTDAFAPPAADGNERVASLAKQLAAVRVACNATGDGRWDEAREALQGLPRQSVFRHWRLFLRGVRCVFEDQLDTARQCFGDLPPHGALARAARAFDPALVAPGPLAPASARVPLYLAATGQPAAWSGPILAATTAWKAGKRVEPFEELRTGMRGAFPAVAPGLAAVLTESVLPFRVRMDDDDFAAADALSDRLGLSRGNCKLQSSEALLALIRPMCLTQVNVAPPALLDQTWRTVIELWNHCEGSNPLRDSVAWQWLGEALGEMSSAPVPYGRFAESAPDFARARKAFDKAVECDPTNEAAALGLLDLLRRQGDTKAYKRLLDELLQRFPANKLLLLVAATQAMDRKSFDKALRALRSALAIDPLDKKIKTLMVVALVQQTRELLRKKRPVAAQWAAMEPLLEDRPPHGTYMLARWISRLRQALLDPEPAAAKQAWADAASMAPSPLERLFVEDSLAAVYRLKPRQNWHLEWNAALKGGALSWAVFSELLSLHAFITHISDWTKGMNARACTWVLDTLAILLGKDLKKDPAGLLAFLDHTAVPPKNLTEHAKEVLALCMRDLVDELEIHADPGKRTLDPRLRMAALIMCERSGNCYYLPRPKFMKDLDGVAADAAASGMPEVVARAKAMRERMSAGPQRDPHEDPFGLAEFFADGDDDDDYDDYDDEEDDEGDEDIDFSNVEDELARLINRLATAVANSDERAIKAARAGMVRCGLSDDTVEQAVQLLIAQVQAVPPSPRGKKPKPPPAKKPKPAPPRGKLPTPPPPLPPPANKPKPPPLVDPNQLDLF